MTITAEQAEKLLEGTTPGPWRWEVSLASKIVKICGGHPHKGFGKYDLTVMDFVRWGMSRAAPMFWGGSHIVHNEPKRADTLAVPVAGREHHERWFRDIDHPDARLIAAAPDLAAALIASETARKLAEERLAKAVEKLNDHALFLEQSHDARMVSIGCDPAKYASGLSMMAQKVRAILKEIDNG